MRAAALLLAALLASGCTSLGGSGGDLSVLQDLAPHELRVRVHNPTGRDVLVAPEAFRLVGADGVGFAGSPSGRDGALAPTLLGPGRSAEGWIAFQVEAFAHRPLTLVLETEGLRLETRMGEG